MSHHHPHTAVDHDQKKPLLWSIALNILITSTQVVGGIWSGSLALLSDALHNFSDVLSLIVSYIAARLSKNQASFHKTFGYKRAEILAAFVNAATLVIVAVILVFEAYHRWRNPHPIDGMLVVSFALLGILANGASVLLLHKHSEENMNMKSAYVHLLTDMLASIAVLVGGLGIRFLGWDWLDPLLTVAIAVYLVYIGQDLLKKSIKVLMLFTPEHIDVDALIEEVCRFDGVLNLHHIHIWQLNEAETHLEAHIDFEKDIPLSDFHHTLQGIEQRLEERFGINHITLQPEYGKADPKPIIVQD
ncbi:MAG: cation diffusion facilitator family transporter [Flavobacteriaceae bacterium]